MLGVDMHAKNVFNISSKSSFVERDLEKICNSHNYKRIYGLSFGNLTLKVNPKKNSVTGGISNS